MKQNVCFIILCLLGVSLSSYGQATVTYYPFNSVFSVSSNVQKSVYLDCRIQMNSLITSLNTELAPMFRISKQSNSFYYLGAGLNTSIVGKITDEEDLIKGYFLSAGVRVNPLESVKNLGLAFELSPYANKNFKSGVFRAWLGISYQFGKKK
ncbi:MAG: hypothetical protein U0Y10_25130 [Spirosomataceae bacterium]